MYSGLQMTTDKTGPIQNCIIPCLWYLVDIFTKSLTRPVMRKMKLDKLSSTVIQLNLLSSKTMDL